MVAVRHGPRQHGQAMVEYMLVVAVVVLVLVSDDDVIGRTADAIRSNWQGYSFAISMSEYPDTDTAAAYREMLTARGVPDARIDYLVDDEAEYVEELIDEYLVSTLPGLGDLDLDALPLNPGDFLNPF